MSDIEIDPRYQRGKIYKIIGSGMRYYGSTILTLKERLTIHKAHYKLWLKGKTRYCKSYDIIAKGNYKIKLVRLYPCNNKPELDRKEGKYILKNECINKVVAGRTKKEYRQDNKEKIREYYKEYHQINKEKIKEYYKEYHKEYRLTNKDKLSEYQNTVISCHCGRTYTRRNKGQHERTKIHKALIASIP